MKYIQCPNVYNGNEKSLFLAGGITLCPQWQSKFVELLMDSDLTLINPRREFFDISNPNIEEEQIKWEFEHLSKASAVSFWFPKETLCPITLYELGKYIVSNKPVFIGVHPEYARKRDIEIQTSLIRPEIKIVYSLKDLASQIKNSKF